jgi:hypothetical protein
LLDTYRARDLLLPVDGLGPVEEVAERIVTALDHAESTPSIS